MAETRVLIVDDEPRARDRLRQLLTAIPGTTVVGEAGNGGDALAAAASTTPDIVLLDVRMPGMDGLEAARRLAALPSPPAVIFTTAYEQHALEAFDAHAAGYLLKPVRLEKLEQAIVRARQPTRAQLGRIQEPTTRRTQLPVRTREHLKLIPVDEILCFIAGQKYVTVRHVGGEDLTDEPLRALEQEFAGEFVRVHRNALAALQHIESVDRLPDGHYLVRLRHGGGLLQVSRRLAGDLLRRLRS
jgi:two-component system response regulator AlgR